MSTSTALENILFLDIETVSAQRHYNDLDETWKTLWNAKSLAINRNDDSPEKLYEKAAIYAEFGKVVCISVGCIRQGKVRLKSFCGTVERTLLESFAELLNRYYNRGQHLLCAHNGKEFDFPYLARRMLVHGIELPALLDIAGKKPWEVKHLDTLELWKFGDYKHYTSLHLLSTLFCIPSPKQKMDGSEVGRAYYEDQNLTGIQQYCEQDVWALIQLYLKYKGIDLEGTVRSLKMA